MGRPSGCYIWCTQFALRCQSWGSTTREATEWRRTRDVWGSITIAAMDCHLPRLVMWAEIMKSTVNWTRSKWLRECCLFSLDARKSPVYYQFELSVQDDLDQQSCQLVFRVSYSRMCSVISYFCRPGYPDILISIDIICCYLKEAVRHRFRLDSRSVWDRRLLPLKSKSRAIIELNTLTMQ